MAVLPGGWWELVASRRVSQRLRKDAPKVKRLRVRSIHLGHKGSSQGTARLAQGTAGPAETLGVCSLRHRSHYLSGRGAAGGVGMR